jgi:peptidyl-prolyl cis-trans isomerase D
LTVFLNFLFLSQELEEKGMLRYLRENTGNWIIKIFLGIIVIVFVFLGVGSMNATRQNEVASVNDKPITFSEFQDAYKNMVQRMRSQFGNALNDDLLKALNVKQQALNGLIDQKLLDMEAEKMKIVVSDQELQDVLLSIKAFQKDGAFNIELYKAVLGQNSLTPETFEALQRKTLKTAKLREMVLNGITVSDTEARNWYLFQNTKMSVDYITVDPGTFTGITPTAEQIKKQYDENPDLYKSEPKRKAVYLVFSPEDHKGTAGVSEDQVKEYYEQNKARFTTPEKVEASHILIKTAEDADEAAVEAARKEALAAYEKAAKGEDFSELAKELSQGPSGPNGGYLGSFERKSMVKPFGDAAFAMKAGEISKPVKTQFGWHVIKLIAKHQAKVESFEKAATLIRNELEGQELQNLAYYKAGEAFDSVMDGDDFEQVALIAKKTLLTTSEFTADGQGLEVENGSEFARSAFELKNDEISEVVQMGNQYFLIKVVEKIEPKLLVLEDVKVSIVDMLTARQQKEAARKAAENLLKKADSGKKLADLAKENNLTLASTELFTRNQSIQGIPGSQGIAAAAFKLTEEKPVYSEVLTAGQNFYVIGFKEKLVPETMTAEENQDKIRQEVGYRKQQQYYSAWIENLKSNADITINTEIIN